MNNLEPIDILEPGGRRRPDLYADNPLPVLQFPAGKEGEPGGLPNLLKEEEKEEDEEEKKEDDDKEEEMEGKQRDDEDMQDSLMVEEGMIVKYLLVLFATCVLALQLLLQGSFHQEKVKQPHCRDTQRPNIMIYLEPPGAPDHLPLATLPCLLEQCNPCGKNF